MSRTRKDAKSEDMSWELESKLEPGMQRFLAHVIENGLQTGLRSQQDFIRHFSPMDIMRGLAERPDLRANILVPTTGLHQKIAFKKPAESAGLDLQIALDEGEADADLIVSLFHPDDRVRYLDRSRLWNYIVEPKFWLPGQRGGAEGAKAHVSFIVDRAMSDGLITYKDLIAGITVATLVQHVPLADLASVIERALSNSHSGKPFTEEDLLGVLPSNILVDHLPLSVIWDQVICPKVAEANGLTTGGTITNPRERESVGVATTAANSLGMEEEGGDSKVNLDAVSESEDANDAYPTWVRREDAEKPNGDDAEDPDGARRSSRVRS